MSGVEGLKPCPFCGSELRFRRGVNPYGHCQTEGCFANRAQTVPLDDPKQVAAWNRRAALSAIEGGGGALQPSASVPTEQADGGVVGHLRARLGWPTGEFSVQDPDPSDDHGPIYLVCPTWGLMLNTSSDPTPGLDDARTRWMASTLNAALSDDFTASAEVGRAVYERIETLIGGNSAELDYLADLVSSVEECGSYSGPSSTPPATPIAGGFGSRPQEAVVPTEPVADRWADLERLAKAADVPDFSLDPSDMKAHHDFSDKVMAFSAAANPAAILELIAAARRDEEAGQ